MTRQPRGDITPPDPPVSDALVWDQVLAHRDPADRLDAAARFDETGVAPATVAEVLADGGDGLYAAAKVGDQGWAEAYGGRVAVALLAAEVGALTAHLTSRASAVRGLAVDALLEDASAVAVAARLGVSRQKVYTVARGSLGRPYLDQVPWRTT